MSVDQPEATTPATADAAAEHTASAPDGPRAATGNAAVDGVVASLDTLADLPVAEHVAVFERAHEQLRAALDAPAGPKPPAPAPGPSAG